MHYCDKECQKEDWLAGHKNECRHMKRKEVVNSLIGLNNTARLTFRILLNLKKNSELWDAPYTLFDGSERSFRELMSHRDKILSDATPGKNLMMIHKLRWLMDFTLGITMNVEDLVDIYGEKKSR